MMMTTAATATLTMKMKMIDGEFNFKEARIYVVEVSLPGIEMC